MTRWAVNIGFLYGELPYAERFRAVRRDGFEAVESAWPLDVEAFVAGVRRAGLRVALLNVFAGDLAAGERGHANDPASVDRWRADVEAGLDLAGEVDCPTLNVLAGNRLADVPLEAQQTCLRDNLGWALARAAVHERAIVVELLNPFDTPDYLVTDVAAAESLLADLGGEGLRLQFDTYHVASIGEDVPGLFERLAPRVGHVQVADAPGRHEPGTGAIDWPRFFESVGTSGYRGAIGLEYVPVGATTASLSWLPHAARPWSQVPFRFALG